MIWKLLNSFINNKLVELVEANDVFLDMRKGIDKAYNRLLAAKLLKAENTSA